MLTWPPNSADLNVIKLFYVMDKHGSPVLQLTESAVNIVYQIPQFTFKVQGAMALRIRCCFASKEQGKNPVGRVVIMLFHISVV